MKKKRVVQAFLAVLAFAGIVFFGCNTGGTFDCAQHPGDPSCENQSGSGDSSGSNSGGNPSPGVSSPSGGASSPSGGTSSPSTGGGASSPSGGTSSPSGGTSSPSTGGGTSSNSGSGNTGTTCPAGPLSAVPANPNTACMSVNGKCYKCNPERVAENQCGQDWLWVGQGVTTQVLQTYWFVEVANCGTGSGGGTTSSQSTGGTASSSSRAAAASSSSTASSGGGSSYPTLTAGASGVKSGWASRYWDGCKPSCAWTNNVPDRNPTKSCKIDGTTVHTNKDAVNKCNDGGDAHTCYSQAPWVEGDIAYAFAASHSNGDCGKCFQVQFDGGVTSNPQSSSPAVTLNHIKGKTLIVKVSNIGGDVSGTQFDLMIPGGGLGAFDGFTMQGGVNSSVISGSTRYGGFVADCISSVGNNGTLAQYQSCLKGKCDQAFTNAQLKAGCYVYADWFGVANNPTFLTKEITCPTQLNSKW